MRLLSFFSLLLLASCSSHKIENKYPTHHKDLYKFGSISGSKGITIIGDKKNTTKKGRVNHFLWHAALDVVSILPISKADPFGGTIITEWHTLEENPNEMFKIIATIDAKELRADALSLKIYKKKKDAMGKWENTNVSKQTLEEFESAIFKKASELRLKEKNR